MKKQSLVGLLVGSLFLAGCGQQAVSPVQGEVPEAYRDQTGAAWSYMAPEGGVKSLALSDDLSTFSSVLSAKSSWGPIEINMSNGEKAPRDGHPLTMGGKVYPYGLGLHANAEISYTSSQATGLDCQFSAEVGIDDEVGVNGKWASIVFQAFADGVKLYDSGVLRGNRAAKHVAFTFPSAKSLKIVVSDNGDSNYFDHTDIANPLIQCAPSQALNKRPVVTSVTGNHQIRDYTNHGIELKPTTVTMIGKNLQNATVSFGKAGPGTNVVISPDGTQLKTVAPLAQNDVPMVVTTPFGKISPGVFDNGYGEFRGQVHLLSLSAVSGPASGGTVVKLSFVGDFHFAPVPQENFDVYDIYFGDTKATNVSLSAYNLITATAPPGVAGDVDVTARCPVPFCYTLQGKVTEAVPFYYTQP